MKRHFKAFVSIVFLILLTQQNATAELNLQVHRHDVSQFPLIRVFLSIEKEDDVIKSPLLSDFKAAMEDGEEVTLKQVASLEKSGENIALLLAVDTSGSMKKKELSAIKGAIKKIIDQKAAEDFIGLISFNDDVVEDCDFTRNANLFLKKLNALQCKGKSTVLFKAVFTGLEMLERPDLPRLRYLIVLSDGKDEGVGFTLDDAIVNANKFNIPIYTIGFASKVNAKFLDNMVRLAKMTGGEYRKVKGSSELYAAYASIASSILKQQVLELEADFKGDGLKHHLEIQYTDSDGKVTKGEVDFLAPLFKEPAAKPSFEDSATEKDSAASDTELIYGFPSFVVYIWCGAVAVLIIIMVIFLFIKRRNKSMLKAEDDLDPLITSKQESEALPEKPQRVPMVNPLILEIPGKGIELSLKPEPMTIGAYPDSSIVLDEDTVSGYHAEISGNGKQWVLKDLGSTNGTKLNGQHIKKPVFIKSGDIIQIGPIEITVKSEKT